MSRRRVKVPSAGALQGTQAHSIMDSWLQEFSWSEMGLAKAKADRNTHLVEMSRNPLTDLTPSVTQLARVLSMAYTHVREAVTKRTKENTMEKLNRQPMFCFELAAKLWHWSQLAYLYQVEPAGKWPGDAIPMPPSSGGSAACSVIPGCSSF